MMKFLAIGVVTILFFTNGCSRSNTPVESEELSRSKDRGTGLPVQTFKLESEEPLKNAVIRELCVSTMRDFLDYVHSPTPNLFFNHDAQARWLSRDLRKAAANHLNVYYGEAAGEHPPPTYPDNFTFYGAWDAPTSYSVLRTDEQEIEIRYHWGPGTNYEGSTRDVVFKFIDEDGSCQIDDLHHKKAEYSSEFWLKSILWKPTYE